jgi:hypothetical protein
MVNSNGAAIRELRHPDGSDMFTRREMGVGVENYMESCLRLALQGHFEKCPASDFHERSFYDRQSEHRLDAFTPKRDFITILQSAWLIPVFSA